MDNYDVLLQEFHMYEQQQACTHQQFTNIIDNIRNEKQSKKFLLSRKRQQKCKLLNKVVRNSQQRRSHPKKCVQTFEMCQQELTLQQITHNMLKKECEQMQKQFNNLHKSVKEMQQQVSVYSRKDNEIKQLKYSSKRQLQTILMQVKNQKYMNTQLDQKHEKVLEQLHDQKIFMEEENRYFANQLKDVKGLGLCSGGGGHRNFSRNGSVVVEGSDGYDQFCKIQEIYSKRKIQEYLRCFYVIFKLGQNWFSTCSAEIQSVKQEAQNNLYITSHFSFLSKNEIVSYYLQKLGQKSLMSIVMIVLQLYRSVTKNISQLENRNNQLNNKVVELREEYEKTIELFVKAQMDRMKSTAKIILQCQRKILDQKKNIKQNNTSIIKVVEKFYDFSQKLKRLMSTVDQVVQLKSQISMQQSGPAKPLHKISKKLENIFQKRNSSNLLSTKSFNMTDSISSSKVIPLRPKKSIHHGLRHNKSQNEKIPDYELLLRRNPRQIICKWDQVIKDEQGFKFIQTVLENDLLRVFLDPSDYDPNKSDLQNENICINRVFESLRVLLKYFRQEIGDRISQVVKINKELEKKSCKQNQYQIQPQSQDVRFVIESKGYFRRDNFKILEKMELMELKKKGLYIPFRYGIDVDEEMVTNKTTIKQPKLQVLDRSRLFTSRKFRYTSPSNPNYISTYRQRLNKADRKIRDLLKNVDDLRVKNKLENRHSSSSRRLSTRAGQTSVLLG